MAIFVQTHVQVNGKSIQPFTQFTLEQSLFQHHTFTLLCPASVIEGKSGTLLQASRNLVGATLELQVDPAGRAAPSDKSLRFRGIVTQVQSIKSGAHMGEIALSGYSPTYLLDNGRHCKSWEKKAIKNIVQDVLKHFPQSLLSPQVKPAYGETLSYTVQYKETAWQFLSRLCATHGEWLYYTGEKLQIGFAAGAQQQLQYGSNLRHFSVALQAQAAQFQHLGYDYINHQVYESVPSGTESKAGLNELGKHTFAKSKQLFASQPKQWDSHFLTSKSQLDHLVNTRAGMQSSAMVEFTGESTLLGMQIGSVVSVEGTHVLDNSTQNYGSYTVTGIRHTIGGEGSYENEFQAIPDSVTLPPVSIPEDPRCEAQSAMVTDNHDPKGLGRVRVKFHWMNGSEKSPWIRVTSPHGGGGKGMFFIPETGEEVIVGFEGDRAEKPYVVGTVYHGQAKNESSNAGNDVKALQTRSGNKVVMNDKDGSVFVEDKDGNSILIDGAGNITVNANKTILLQAVDKITLSSKVIELLAENDINMASKTLSSEQSQTATVTAKNTVTLGSDNKIEIGAKVALEATAKTVDISGDLSTTVAGKVTTTVQGGMVKLNC